MADEGDVRGFAYLENDEAFSKTQRLTVKMNGSYVKTVAGLN